MLSNTLTLNLSIFPSGSWLWGSHLSYSFAQFLGVHPLSSLCNWSPRVLCSVQPMQPYTAALGLGTLQNEGL